MDEGIVTSLEVQKRNKKRVNVYLNGVYAFSLSMDEAARLHKGQALSQADVAAMRDDDEVMRAVDSAARFLSHRPRSEQEVRRNLTEKETPPPVIDAAVERLRTLGYLDDHTFASFWVQNRTTFKPVSPKALRYELRQKGVPDAVIADVLETVDADDAAYRAAETQARRLHGLSQRDFRTKLNGFMQRRGFSYSDARAAIDRVIEELSEQDPDYFADADEHTADWSDD